MTELAPLASFVRSSGNIKGMFVNFHIPYPGIEHLALESNEREKIARDAIRLKLEGYPILNTVNGLGALANNDWPRPLDLSIITDCCDLYSCCRARGNDNICRECGYAVWAELSRLYKWDFPAIFELLRHTI
jgi:hypothetical protein